MANLISKNAYVFASGEIIMAINDLATKKKNEGIDVTNGSIGMLYDEDKHLASLPFVDDIIKNTLNDNLRKYDSISGSKSYKDGIKNWLFASCDMGDAYIDVCATLGATGALALLTKCYGEINQEVLIPSIRWSNYDSIILENNEKVLTYELFNEQGRFNLDAFKEKVNYSCSTYHRALILINDPCENPTGYTLKEDEWDEILSFLKNKSLEHKIVLIDDVAYLNFSDKTYDPIFEKFAKAVSDNFIITIAFSSSKTLQIYGLRGGAACCIASNQENIQEFANVSKTYARSVWSSPNHLASNVMSILFNDQEKSKILKEKLGYYQNLLTQRANAFIMEAHKYHLSLYPFDNGFFIMIKCKNNHQIYEHLTTHNIFLVPMNGGLRLSIASITIPEAAHIASYIKEAIALYD
jgi:aspartate/tyrosine/aromatic aminotransferase